MGPDILEFEAKLMTELRIRRAQRVWVKYTKFSSAISTSFLGLL